MGEFSEINFRNVVDFNRLELIRIIRGESATRFFSAMRRRRLKKQGILIHEGTGSGMGGILRVTEKARAQIERGQG